MPPSQARRRRGSTVQSLLPASKETVFPSRLAHVGGWGNFPVQACHLYRPESVANARSLLNAPPQKSLIARGLGRSYGDAAINEGNGIILTERLDRMLDFSSETGILECEAGVTLADIIDCFLPKGFFPPVTPGTRFVSVGGAIAADIHGKNHHCEGSFAQHLLELTLLTARGEAVTCSPTSHPDLYWATVGGMGLTGMILSARLRLRKVSSAYIKVDYFRIRNLEETLGQLQEIDSKYHYSVAWIDCLSSGRNLGRAILMGGDHAEPLSLPPSLRENCFEAPARRRLSVPFKMPSFILNSASAAALNNAYYYSHPTQEGKLVDYDKFFYPLDSWLHWNRMYGRRGFIQFQVVFPFKHSHEGIKNVIELLVARRFPSFLAVLKRFGAPSSGLLSFPHEGYTLALDLPNFSSGLSELILELTEITLKHEGRVYLAKDAMLSPKAFSAMYPALPRFQEIRKKWDPHHCFASSLSRRLGMERA